MLCHREPGQKTWPKEKGCLFLLQPAAHTISPLMGFPAGCKVLTRDILYQLLLVPQENVCSEPGCVVERVPLSHLCGTWSRAPIGSLHPSLVARGSQGVAGMCSPCWALLINIRNSTRGYEASNQSVISCMGFAKCLSPDNKQGTSGPASVKELLYDSRAPHGMLGAALGHSVPGPRLCWDVRSGQVLAPCPRMPTAQTSLSSLLQLI